MISSEEVMKMLSDCFFTQDEGQPAEGDFVKVDGLTTNFGLHPKRLAEKKDRLIQIIDELNLNFLEGVGGGYSFLHLPFDKHGNHWGEHPDCEALIALCMGNGLARYCLPRDMWDALPGGVPYVVFAKNGFES